MTPTLAERRERTTRPVREHAAAQKPAFAAFRAIAQTLPEDLNRTGVTSQRRCIGPHQTPRGAQISCGKPLASCPPFG